MPIFAQCALKQGVRRKVVVLFCSDAFRLKCLASIDLDFLAGATCTFLTLYRVLSCFILPRIYLLLLGQLAEGVENCFTHPLFLFLLQCTKHSCAWYVLIYFLFDDDHLNSNPWIFFSCFGLLDYILKIEWTCLLKETIAKTVCHAEFVIFFKQPFKYVCLKSITKCTIPISRNIARYF